MIFSFRFTLAESFCPRLFYSFALKPRMQRSIASSRRTSGAGLASRRYAASENATKAATTATTSTPLLLCARSTPSLSLPSTRAGAGATATAAAPRRLLAPPPRASFLDGLLQTNSKKKNTPGGSSPFSSPFRPPGAALALVDSLLEAVEGSDAGAADKTSEEQREEIARLAASLKKYRMRNPAQSELLWGRLVEFSVVEAAGGRGDKETSL